MLPNYCLNFPSKYTIFIHAVIVCIHLGIVYLSKCLTPFRCLNITSFIVGVASVHSTDQKWADRHNTG